MTTIRTLIAVVVMCASSSALAATTYLRATFDGATSYTGSGPLATAGGWDSSGVEVGTGDILDTDPAALSVFADPLSGLLGSDQGVHLRDVDGNTAILRLFLDPTTSGPTVSAATWIEYVFRIDPDSVSGHSDALVHLSVYDGAGGLVIAVSLGKSVDGKLRYKLYARGGDAHYGDLSTLGAADEWRFLVKVDPIAGKQTHWAWKNRDTLFDPVLGAPLDLYASPTVPLQRLLIQTSWSNTLDAVVDQLHVSDSGPPMPPSSLRATPEGTGRIDLIWADNAPNETGFRIERSPTGAGSWSEIATVPAGQSTYSDTDLAPKTKYFYRVAAYNDEGISPWSNPTWGLTVYVGKPLSDWIDVTSYGANGQDDLDDTAAIQAAISALHGLWGAATAHVLYFPDGTYRISDVLRPGIGPGLVLETEHNGLLFEGQSPGGAVLQWVGSAGTLQSPIALFHSNGNPRCTFRNLVWDGGGAPYVVAFDESSRPGTHDGASAHYDSTFQNAYIGLRIGHFNTQNSEITVRRCRFLENSAGISVEDWNAMNIWVWDSEFARNEVGASNNFAIPFYNATPAGIFHVLRGRFSANSRADVEIANTGGFTLRDSWSRGSGRFLDALGPTSAGAVYLVMGNKVDQFGLAPGQPTDGYAIRFRNAGPLLLFDNLIDSDGRTGSAVFAGTASNTDVLAVHNQYTVPGDPYTGGSKDVRRLADDDDPSFTSLELTVPALPVATDPVAGRPVYTVTDGDNVQEVIDAAIADRSPAVVHFPNGRYDLAQTISIPASGDVIVMGNGPTTLLNWIGPVGQDMVSIDGHQVRGLTIRDLLFRGDANTATAIRVKDLNQEQSRAFLNRVNVDLPAAGDGHAGLVVDACDRVAVDLLDSGFRGNLTSSGGGCARPPIPTVGMRIQAGPQPQVGTAYWSGGAGANDPDVEILNGPQGVKVLLTVLDMENSARTARVSGVGGLGDVAIHWQRMATRCSASPAAVSVDHFNGNVSVLGNYLFDQENEGARVEQTGSEPVNIELIGNAAISHPEYAVDTGGTFIRVQEQRICTPSDPCGGNGTEQIPDDPGAPSDEALLEEGVRLIRSWPMPGFYDEAGATALYQLNLDNLRIERPLSGVVLSGGIPGAPSDLVATAVDGNRVDLVWTDGSDDEDGFKVRRSASAAGPFDLIGTPGANVTSFRDTSAADGTRSWYQVVAFRNRTGESGATNTVSALTPLYAPTGLTAASAGNATIDLGWLNNSASGSEVRIERGSDADSLSFLKSVPATSTGSSDAGLAERTTYVYRVRAENTETVSGYSNTASATTPLNAPTNLIGTARTPRSVELTWSDNSAIETGYRVDRSADPRFGRFTAYWRPPGSTAFSQTGLTAGATYYYRVKTRDTLGSSDYSNTVRVVVR